MKKLFTLLLLGGLLFVGAGNAWGVTSTTVYYAISSSDLGEYKVRYNAQTQADATNGDVWETQYMTKTAYTYGGKYVYVYTYDDLWDGVNCMQFQLVDNNGNVKSSPQQPYSSWTSVSTYNHKIYVHNVGWQDTYAVNCDWGSGWTQDIMWDGGFTKSLPASSNYAFSISKNHGAEYYGQSQDDIHWYEKTKTFHSNGGDCTFYTNFAGNYTFTYEISDSKPVVTITYPTQTYTAYFENSTSWSQVKAHIWRNESSSDHAITTWPGQAVTTTEGNYYKATFTSPAEPTGIVWDNLDSGEGSEGETKTSNFSFTNNGIYRLNEVISSYSVNFTPSDGYATFYHPTENILLPAGVTAYSVSYSAPTLGLSAFSGTNADVIPADLAVILTGTPSGSATLYTTGRTAYASGSSVLGGSTGSVSGGEYIYVLGTAGNSGAVTGTAFYKLSSGTVPANRAYLDTKGKSAPSAIRLDNGENTTTNLESVENTNNSVKFIKNGQLYIMRDGVVYDVMGRIAE